MTTMTSVWLTKVKMYRIMGLEVKVLVVKYFRPLRKSNKDIIKNQSEKSLFMGFTVATRLIFSASFWLADGQISLPGIWWTWTAAGNSDKLHLGKKNQGWPLMRSGENWMKHRRKDFMLTRIQHVLLVMSALSFLASEWRTVSTLPALLLTLTYFKF